MNSASDTGNISGKEFPLAACIHHALDQLAIGLIVVSDDCDIVYANRCAQELKGLHELLDPDDAPDHGWSRATRSRLRSMVLNVGEQGPTMLQTQDLLARGVGSILVLPIDGGAEARAFVMIGTTQPVPRASLELFASQHRLTSSEYGVLSLMCQGQAPFEIASFRDVAVSTVVSQIKSIRAKAGASSVRELLLQLSALPPLHQRSWQAHTARAEG